ncbi:hypothetical protein pdam_00023933, partial [Pocillopora damicornis]
ESFHGVQGCVGKHSTLLHPRRITIASTTSTMTENPMGGQGKGVKPLSVNLNPANNDWVKAKGHGKMVETYAFLNSGLKHLEKLNCKGTKTRQSLTTLHGENEPIECSLVSLEVFDLRKKTT